MSLFLQSDSLVVCDVDETLMAKLKKFRFRKETSNAAIIMKIDKDKQLVIIEEEYEVGTITIAKLCLYSLCIWDMFMNMYIGCKPEQQMMYAGSKNRLVQAAELTKVFEIRNTDDLTEDWLKEKLSFFG
ncbi:UNVERIFIED_CONTAM: hypothetical protein FKN15_065891 [Acipenser sinensis]